ncbi:MAG TPA: universal stress protein [Anaerolineales bacterium]|nr:universal stress protein [Anaerolineales bacterium]
MFDPILVPLDGSLLAEGVLSHAGAMARAFAAETVLFHVHDQHEQHASPQLLDLLSWQIRKSETDAYLKGIETRLRSTLVRTETVILEGPAAQAVIDFAYSRTAGLIVLSSHGSSGVNQWGVSSVAHKIILSAPTSILIVRAHQPDFGRLTERAYRRILVPLDGSRRAENVLPAIAHLARFHDSQIHIALVVTSPEMARQMPPENEDVQLSRRIVARNREESTRYLDQIRSSSPLGGVSVETHLLTGSSAPAELHGLVDKENMDLVVLSAHGYSGNHEWPYGSVVNNAILYGKVPLLIVQDRPNNEQHDLLTRFTPVTAGVRERAA